jgi:hypothetical protein
MNLPRSNRDKAFPRFGMPNYKRFASLTMHHFFSIDQISMAFVGRRMVEKEFSSPETLHDSYTYF